MIDREKKKTSESWTSRCKLSTKGQAKADRSCGGGRESWPRKEAKVKCKVARDLTISEPVDESRHSPNCPW